MSQAAAPRKQAAARVIHALMQLCASGCGIASLLAFAGGAWWFLDLLSHFRVQYALLLLLCGVSFVLTRHWRWAGVSGLLLAVNGSLILPLYLGSPAVPDPQQPQIEVLVFNVNYQNRRVAQVASYLARQDADVVIVLEATPRMLPEFQAALAEHQMVGQARVDAFGILLFTRLDVQTHEMRRLAGGEMPAIAVGLRKEGARFDLLGLHTMPPMGGSASRLRDRMLREAARWATEATHPIVVGDFNATPWSSAFNDLLERGSLRNSQRGFGLQTTWPSALWPLSIPIDHCVHGQRLTTIERSAGPFLGSDHRPLRCRLGFRSVASVRRGR